LFAFFTYKRGSKKLQNGFLIHWLHEASCSPTRSGVRMMLATNLADFLVVLSILRLAVAVAAAARCHDNTFIFPDVLLARPIPHPTIFQVSQLSCPSTPISCSSIA
jgi:hypothetical protein